MKKQQILSKVARRLVRPVRLYALWQSRDPYLQLLAASAQGALTGALTEEERQLVQRIEQLRAELDSSTEQVTRLDFGAGLREGADSRSSLEQASGVEVKDQVSRISRASSKSGIWALFLFKLVRALRPQRCLEMGTALGLSGAYQAGALQLNGQGSFTSLEGSEELAKIARRNWERLGLVDARVVVGQFADTLGSVLPAGGVDYVFVDGHHDERATLAYFERLLPALASPACLVFDDIKWSQGMQRAWDAISRDPRSKIAVDFGALGVVILGDAISKRRPVRAPLG
jgi:predicted O-methyltransferase YrrM